MVEVVQVFIGQEKRVKRASTTVGTVRNIKSFAAGDGWGVKLRASKVDLAKIGAFETQAGGWLFVWYDGVGRNRREMYVDCIVN